MTGSLNDRLSVYSALADVQPIRPIESLFAQHSSPECNPDWLVSQCYVKNSLTLLSFIIILTVLVGGPTSTLVAVNQRWWETEFWGTNKNGVLSGGACGWREGGDTVQQEAEVPPSHRCDCNS
ncbi:hypothetical protein J6590_085643 [Homalodisca vitripennis]|nr:hypothetical protein J6590_085643 [Homalodisca vitripennis]